MVATYIFQNLKNFLMKGLILLLHLVIALLKNSLRSHYGTKVRVAVESKIKLHIVMEQ